MAESQTLHSKYRYQLRQSASRVLGDCITGTPTGGTATTMIDTNLNETDDIINDWDLAFYAGTHINTRRTVTDWDQSDHTATIATVTTNVDTTDLYELHHKFTTAKWDDFINRAIDLAKDSYLKTTVDESVYMQYYKQGETRLPKREYDVPAGFDYISDIYMGSSTPYQIEDCGDAWSEKVDGDVTSGTDTIDYQESSCSVKLTVGSGISDGDVLATEAISSTDISGYAKVQFWIKVSTAVVAADLCLLLDNGAYCESPLETLEIGALTANTWSLQTLTLANWRSDTAIVSIGLEYNANAGANIIWLDDVCVIKAGEPRFDEEDKIDRRSWSIVHGTTPQIKLHTEVPIVSARHLRIVGQVSQGSLSADTDTCFVDPEFIIQQVCAFAYQAGQEYDAMKIAQQLADGHKKRSRVQILPGSRAVKEI